MPASTVLQISRYDSFLYDVTLQQTDAATGVTGPVTVASVQAYISLWPPSLTPVSNTLVQMTHLGDGRWVGELFGPTLTAAVAAIANNTQVAIVYLVNNVMVRYREASIVAFRRSEAL